MPQPAPTSTPSNGQVPTNAKGAGEGSPTVDEDGFTIVKEEERRGFGSVRRVGRGGGGGGGSGSDFFSSDEEEMEAKDISRLSVAIRGANESMIASDAEVSLSVGGAGH